ncbi:MAG: glycosyltransferase [Deltaproteobacteria bacterium]|nr:glycosyltransferase [Deltaproteobacteria bacterium]
MLVVPLCILYFLVLGVLSLYGFHRLHLVLLCRRHRARIGQAPALAGPPLGDDELPQVTVQLPIFNESTVVQRLIRHVSRMDYPRGRLEIQVLDDSTDETSALARAEVARLRSRGFDAVYLHRDERVGYKAGALDEGLRRAKGGLVAIFDADFIPRPDFLRSLVGHFRDPKVAMVQARWAHLNRDASLLTRIQALMLDGHHLVENRARYGAGLLFNFSGTGGMWRCAAIEDAGGWQHDTVTEDLDLSYRAQLRGWKFIYREDVVSPAELPEDMAAVRMQQYRWAKGTVQTARKLLRTVLRSRLRFAQRIEALFHLTPHFAYPLMVALSLLMLPVLLAVTAKDATTLLLVDLPLGLAPMGSLAAFYMGAEAAQGRSRWGALKLLPALIALGVGLAPYLTQGVRAGLRERAGEFVRTPKHGVDRRRYWCHSELPLMELGCGVVTACSVVVALQTGHWLAAPFAALFTLGYGCVAWLLLSERVARRVGAPVPAESATDVAGGAASRA